MVGPLGGLGGGAGGFCARVTGTRIAIASANSTEMPLRWLIDRFLGSSSRRANSMVRFRLSQDSVTAVPIHKLPVMRLISS